MILGNGIVIVLSVTCLILLFLYLKSKEKEGKETIRYVDTSGIVSNPPRFIEVAPNKTINFSFDKYKISICHLPIFENIELISKLSGHFAIIKYGLKKKYDTPFSKADETRIYQAHYMSIVKTLYTLSKPFNKKRGYKKAFEKKCYGDSNFVFMICKEIFDYWQNMGKLLGVLEKGLTPRLQYGEELGSDRLKWDEHGKRLITPRYAFIPKSKQKSIRR